MNFLAMILVSAAILTPKPPETPRLTGARVVGARPAHPVLFTVTATGERPLGFSASGLPAGLRLDAATGRITGTVVRRGEYRVRVTARNARGSADRELRIVIGDRLALTPPLGWNSWNCFGPAVTAADIRAAADAFVKTGLADHGWSYINIDDYWMTRPLPDDPVVKLLEERAAVCPCAGFEYRPQADPSLVGPARDGAGRINGNRRFPDLAGLTNYIHGLGLKAGIYSSPGPLTCGGCTASYGHEALDAARFAAWGFDYLKYDWCSYCLFAKDDSAAEAAKPYRVMSAALAAQPRDIVFSISNDGASQVWDWGAAAGGNSWRVTGDIRDTWKSIAGIGFAQDGRERFAGPGRWNDADMLAVGWVGGWNGRGHATMLTEDEQYTHMSLWSLLASPLLIGCDLTRLDAFTLNLLTNDEVLAVDQDPLGRPAHRAARQGDGDIWVRPLEDGSVAVGLFNRGAAPARIAARWSDLGLRGARTVRDLWRQRELGRYDDAFAATVPPHGVLLLKLTPP